MKCDVWKFKLFSDQRRQDELRFSIWRFFEQSAFVTNHLLCYWPTTHNSISKVCPTFQVLSSHFFEINELLSCCSMSIEQKLCDVKIFPSQLQFISNAIRSIDQRFVFKNSRISCLALIFNLNNQRTTVLYAKKSFAGGETRRVMYRFFQAIDANLRLSG